MKHLHLLADRPLTLNGATALCLVAMGTSLVLGLMIWARRNGPRR